MDIDRVPDTVRGRRRHPVLFSTTALVAVAFMAATPVLAGPEGGQIANGKIKIDQSGDTTTITQRSKRGVINWTSFDVDAGETVIFKQPKRSSITLNRVTGGTRSDILGSLQANGRVWIVNPNGVFVGPNAAIDVGGILMTTADIRDRDFMNGRYEFDIPSGQGVEAEIVNEGRITLKNRGVAALVAPHVRNDGVITGKLSTVVLGGAETFGIDFYGDGLINFEINGAVGAAPADGKAVIENGGAIRTPGGRVLMTAETVSGVIDAVINMDGVIEATTVKNVRGEIILSGGPSGAVNVAGVLEADGNNRGQKGGTVKILGEHVALADSAVIDASGRRGGGEILIGGNFQGEGPEPNALTTTIAEGARLSVDARGNGNGGTLIAWSDERTDVDGFLSARGGSLAGNGGFIEVSSRGVLQFGTAPDIGAPNGRAGTLLLDPPSLTVEVDGGSDLDGSSVDPSAIEIEGNVILDAEIDITIAAPVTKPGNGTLYIATNEEGTSGITSGEFVNIIEPITMLGANSDLVILSESISIGVEGSTFFIDTPGTVTLLAIQTGAGTGSGSIDQSNPIRANTLIIPRAESVFFPSSANEISNLAIQDIGGSGSTGISSILIENSGDLTVTRANLPGGFSRLETDLDFYTDGNTVTGVEAIGNVELVVDGTLRINQPVTSFTRIIIETGQFLNNAGANGLDTGTGGDFIVYSTGPNDRLGIPGVRVFDPDSTPETSDTPVIFDQLTTRSETPESVVVSTTLSSTFVFSDGFPAPETGGEGTDPRPPLPPQIPTVTTTTSIVETAELGLDGQETYLDAAPGEDGGVIQVEGLFPGDVTNAFFGNVFLPPMASDGNAENWIVLEQPL